jgi:hypothetical protein
MNKNCKLLFFTFIIMSGMHGQFLDAVREISFDGPGQRVKTSGGYQLTGSAISISNGLEIEGAAIRFAGDQQAMVLFQFMEADGQWSEKYQAKTFAEPNSDRFIASILDTGIASARAIRYEVQSLKMVRFLTGGVFDRRDGETKISNNPPAIKPKRMGVEKPTVISREEWGARPPESGYSNHPYFRKLTLHHAAGWAAKSLDEGKPLLSPSKNFIRMDEGGVISDTIFWWTWRAIFIKAVQKQYWALMWAVQTREYWRMCIGMLSSTRNQLALLRRNDLCHRKIPDTFIFVDCRYVWC